MVFSSTSICHSTKHSIDVIMELDGAWRCIRGFSVAILIRLHISTANLEDVDVLKSCIKIYLRKREVR